MPGDKGGRAAKEVDISKSLSYLLRHGARKEGLVLDEGGWANVGNVVGDDLFLLFFWFLGFWLFVIWWGRRGGGKGEVVLVVSVFGFWEEGLG